ncbi:MAG: MBL fold metallo-hydrolase [archaeon GB-1867-005]|nr:MBL fold metallo-hydrolase [Candidatus Culexmicrobium cathedralense]
MSAKIGINGAIKIGKYFACDAHDPASEVRVVTHAHFDHIINLNSSLKESKRVVMTEATRDLLQVIKRKLNLKSKVLPARYGETLKWKDQKLTLHYADHIIGAAQVLVEDEKGNRIVYTGDFRLPKTPILDADILIMEATYGKPDLKRPPTDVIREALVKLVKKSLAIGPVHIFGFHGKAQEVMELLRNSGFTQPFIATSKVYIVTEVCRKHGMRVGEVLLKGTMEAEEVMKSGEYIMFHHASTLRTVKINGVKIHLTGWEFRKIIWKVANKHYRVALSDHADFTQLILYAATSKPKLVITDNYRVGYAAILAKEIERRLGIKAIPMP